MRINEKCWLMKTEPSECSIEDAFLASNCTIPWFGVRNYQARNFMRDEFSIGQKVFFYHSSCPKPGIVGVAKVASAPYADPTQFDPQSRYFDPRSTLEKPRWVQVDIQVLFRVKKITLTDIRNLKGCEEMMILKKGNRLSITPVTVTEWKAIEKIMRKLID